MQFVTAVPLLFIILHPYDITTKLNPTHLVYYNKESQKTFFTS